MIWKFSIKEIFPISLFFPKKKKKDISNEIQPERFHTEKLLVVGLTNNTDEIQEIDLFSLHTPQNKNIEIVIPTSSYEYMLKTITSDPLYVVEYRIETTNIMNFMNCMSMISKDRNGHSSNYPFLPMLHYSPNQFQVDTIDIDGYYMNYEGKSSTIIRIQPKSQMNIIFSERVFKNLDEFKWWVDKFGKPSSVNYNSYTSLIIENNTDEKQRVKLFDYDYYMDKENKPPVIIRTPTGQGITYEEQLQVSNEDGKAFAEMLMRMDKIKIFSENVEQITQPLSSKGFKIESYNPADEFNPNNNYMRDVADCTGFMYEFEKGKPIEVDVLPNTTVCYIFIDSGSQERINMIEEFKQKYNIETVIEEVTTTP